ncbi:MAG: hypothetical protein NDP13_06565 [Crenarchaeota archaeon]|nr:hypothetical protein [Thermoproteota archaeon]
MLNEGKASFRDLESRLGIPKSTLQRWYAKRLEKIIEERKKELIDLEQKISKLQMEFSSLKKKYEEKIRVLEEEYSKKRKSLEEIKAFFEKQGISLDEGLKILSSVVSLKKEHEILRDKVERLKNEASSRENRIKILRNDEMMYYGIISRLQAEISRLQAEYNSWVYWQQNELPELEKTKSQLQNSIKMLEDKKLGLMAEIDELENTKAKLQKSIKALEDAKAVLMIEIDERKKEAEDHAKRIRKEAEDYAERIRKETEDHAKRIIADAEEKRKKIMDEIESLKREREKIRAEKELLKSAVRGLAGRIHMLRELSLS